MSFIKTAAAVFVFVVFAAFNGPAGSAPLAPASKPAMAPAIERVQWGCRGSRLSCEDLAYACSQGRETPYSVRPFCGDYYRERPRRREYYGDGYRGGYGAGRGGCRGSGLSCRDLEIACSQGRETPYSVRPYCR